MENNVVFLPPTVGFPLAMGPIIHRLRLHFPGIQVLYLPGLGVTRHTEDCYLVLEQRLLSIAATGPITGIAWSQGSSHILRFAARHPDKVNCVIDVGGPHRGSLWAWFFPYLHGVFDLRVGCGLVRRFSREMSRCSQLPPVFSYVAHHDLVVFGGPPKGANVTVRVLSGLTVNHLTLFFIPGVMDQMVADIESAASPSTKTPGRYALASSS
jgi:pimeloyl-ACP methyl ester carboxylesterase